jgi:chaperone required for assembly of F1-ATPase
MPVTRAANAALDKVAPQREAVVAELAAFGASDLLCYRAGAPEGLVARQDAAWDPLLDWAEGAHGARLRVTTGVMPVAQDPGALDRLAAPLRSADAFALTALSDLVALSGSLVIGLAAVSPDWEAEDLWERSRIDEAWQEEVWGRDDEAAEVAALKRRDFLAAGRLHALAMGQMTAPAPPS